MRYVGYRRNEQVKAALAYGHGRCSGHERYGLYGLAAPEIGNRYRIHAHYQRCYRP